MEESEKALDFKSKYFQVLLNKQYQRFDERLVDSIRNGHRRKLEVLLDLIDEFKLKLNDPLPNARTLLHTALLFSNGDHEIYRLIAERYPSQLYQVKSESEQSVLHLAVAKQDGEAAKFWIEAVMKIKNGSQIASSFLNMPLNSKAENWTDTCNEAELPLSIAAWNTDHRMIELLLDHNAQLDAVNHRHQTVFHVLVEAAAKPDSKTNTSRLDSLVNTYHKLIAATRSYSTMVSADQRLSYVLNIKDIQGHTPLELAAKNASGRMYEAIINTLNLYKFLDTVDGVSNVYLYDITNIDSAIEEHNSVMQLVAGHDADEMKEYHYFTEHSPILDIIRMKWEAYRKYYTIWGMIHIFLCLAPVVYVYHSDNTNYSLWFQNRTEKTSTLNSTIMNSTGEASPSSNFPTAQMVLFVYQMLFHIYAILMFISETYHFFQGIRTQVFTIKQIVNSIGSGPFHLILLLFGTSGLVSLTTASTNQDYAFVVVNVTMILGWLFVLFFTRAIKLFSHFTVIILEAVFTDLIKVSLVFSMILIPFSAAITSSFPHPRPEEYSTIWMTSYTLLHVALGLKDLEDLKEANNPSLAMALYVTFLAITYILLFNILIALLSEISIRISANKAAQWHLQKMNVIIYIESRLPKALRYICGSVKETKLFPAMDEAPSTPRSLSKFVIPLEEPNHNCSKAKTKRHYLEVKMTLPHHFTSISEDADHINQRRALLARDQEPAGLDTTTHGGNDLYLTFKN